MILNASPGKKRVKTSAEGSDAVGARLRREPPPEAVLWKAGDDVEVQIMAQYMTEPSAEQFLKMFLDHMQRRTWRFQVWRF